MHALALALPLLLAVEPTVEAGLRLRTEAQGARQAADRPGFEGRLTPALHLGLESPRQELDVTWLPSLAWYDQMEGFSPFVIQEGTLEGRLDLGRRWTLEATARGRVGEESILSVYTDAPAEVDFVPTLVPIDIASLRSELALAWEAGPRTTWRAEAAYALQGGTTDEARSIIPLSRGPQAGLGLTRLLSPRDTLEAEVFVGEMAFLAAPPRAAIDGLTYRYVGATAGWTRALSPRTDLVPRLGLLGVRAVSDPSSEGSVLPEATVGLTHTLELARGNRLVLEGSAGATPDINRYGGRLEEALGGQVGLAWRRGDRFAAGLGLGYFGVLYLEEGETGALGRGRLYGRYEVVRHRVALELGASGYTQRIPGDFAFTVNDAWNAHLQVVFTTGAEE